MEVCGYLPTQSGPRMNMIHEMLVRLGYIVDGLGQYSDEVIAHYRRVEAGSTQQNYREARIGLYRYYHADGSGRQYSRDLLRNA